MINLGFNSGKNMPDVYLELAPRDRILEGVAVLLMAAAWVVAIVFYFGTPLPASKLFLAPGVMLVLTAASLWASRAPIRFYNFPVKLNKQNYVMQYLMASRFVRAMNIIVNLLLFFDLFVELESRLNVQSGLFGLLVNATTGLLGVSLVVYFVFAFRNR